jgi:NCS1 family nucleobase:cation symporter-1
LLGFVATSVVYTVFGVWIMPPTETFIERAVLPDEVYDEQGGVDEGISVGSGEERNEKTGWKAKLDRIL